MSEPVVERASSEEPREGVKRGKNDDAGLSMKLGKTPRLQYYGLMVMMSAITDVNLLASDFVKAVSVQEGRGYIAEAFTRMRILVLKWNYKVQDASRIVASALPKSEFKLLLERFSLALAAGMKVSDFNRVESSKYMIQFEAEYARIIDRLKQISETFSALLSSVSFLAVSMLISTMTFGFGSPEEIMIATAVAIGGTIFAMVFLIRSYAPKERVMREGGHKPFNLDRYHSINRPLLAACGVVGVCLPGLLMALSPFFVSHLELSLGIPMIVAGVPLIFFGRLVRKRIKKIKLIEDSYPAFIKNFGDAFSVTASAKETIRILSESDYGVMNGPIGNLHKRFEGGINSDTAWALFNEECGSQLIDTHTASFQDALSLGARAAPASEAVFKAVNGAQSRRKQREQVAGYLKATVIPLQLTFAGVLTLVQAIVAMFSEIASRASTYLTLLTPISQNAIVFYVYGIIASSLVGASVGVSIMEGESEYDLTYFLGLELLLTGLVVAATAFGASALLGQFNSINLGSAAPPPPGNASLPAFPGYVK